jgi:hypothetical protein
VVRLARAASAANRRSRWALVRALRGRQCKTCWAGLADVLGPWAKASRAPVSSTYVFSAKSLRSGRRRTTLPSRAERHPLLALGIPQAAGAAGVVRPASQTDVPLQWPRAAGRGPACVTPKLSGLPSRPRIGGDDVYGMDSSDHHRDPGGLGESPALFFRTIMSDCWEAAGSTEGPGDFLRSQPAQTASITRAAKSGVASLTFMRPTISRPTLERCKESGESRPGARTNRAPRPVVVAVPQSDTDRVSSRRPAPISCVGGHVAPTDGRA